MTDVIKIIKLVSAYIVIAIFCLSATGLFAIIIHLSCYFYEQLQKNKQKLHILLFILITIVSIILFELMLLLVIVVCVQISLMDTYAVSFISHNSHMQIEYVIAISDIIAHLCVIIVFIARFRRTFYNNKIFGDKYLLFCVLYICVAALAIFGVIIIVIMGIEHILYEEHKHSVKLMLLENILDVLFHIMCLWILYLFIHKLYLLLKFSIQIHIKSGKKTDFLKELIEASKSNPNSSKHSTKENETKSIKSINTMTIDGVQMQIELKRRISPGPSPAPSPSPEPVCKNVELTITNKATSDHEHTDIENTDATYISETKGESATMDLIRSMSKMSVLVTLCVLMSILGAIGHTIIELKMDDDHHIDIDALWLEILHVVDFVVTSLMLYLQFNFTNKMYRFVLGGLDVWFLTNCLKLTKYVWQKKETVDTTASILVETETNGTKTLDTPNNSDTEIP
eukprot:393177_1